MPSKGPAIIAVVVVLLLIVIIVVYYFAKKSEGMDIRKMWFPQDTIGWNRTSFDTWYCYQHPKTGLYTLLIRDRLSDNPKCVSMNGYDCDWETACNKLGQTGKFKICNKYDYVDKDDWCYINAKKIQRAFLAE